MDYKSKYLKYKSKYEALKNQAGGQPKTTVSQSNDDFPINRISQFSNKTERDKAINEYYEMFLEKINTNNDLNNRYQTLEMNPTVGRLFEKLVYDVITLSNQLDLTNQWIEKLASKSMSLEHELKDHYHDIPTSGMKNFVKNYNGPIPSFGKHTYDGPKIVPVDGPKIVPVENEQERNIVKQNPETGEWNAKIVPVENEQGRNIVSQDPVTGKWNTTITNKPPTNAPVIVQRDPNTGKYTASLQQVSDSKSTKDICQLKGGEVIRLSLDQPDQLDFYDERYGIVDYVEDGKIYAYFGDSHYPESYDCNLFYNNDQRYRIFPRMNKNDIAVEKFGPKFWFDESFSRRPLKLREFIDKYKLKLPPNKKSGFIA